MAATQRTWATAEDWTNHRPTITRLYVEENRQLSEVIEMMKNDHQFHATPRMYKTRIKRWGLGKNLTAGEVHPILRIYGARAIAADAAPAVLIRGRPVDPKKLKQYLKRTTRDVADLNAFLIGGEGSRDQTAIATPAPRRLNDPDVLRLPEEIMMLAGQLAAGSHENGSWAANSSNNVSFTSSKLMAWENHLTVGQCLVQSGRHKHGFQIFDRAFSLMGELIEGYEPALFIYTMFHALDMDAGLSQSLLGYAAEMSKAKLSARHPLAVILGMLRRAGIGPIQKSAWTILLSYLDILQQQFGKSQEDLSLLTYWLLNDALYAGLINLDEFFSRIRATINHYEALGLRGHTLQARSVSVNALCWAGQFPAAKALLSQVIQENRKGGKNYNKDIDEQSYTQTFCVARNIGTVAETIKAGRELLQFLKERDAWGDVVYYASRLQVYMLDHGVPPDSVGLEEYLDPEWDTFCRGIDISS